MTVVLCVGAGLAYTIKVQPQYQSSAQLFTSSSASETNEILRSTSLSSERAKSYAALLSGHEVTRRVIEKLKLDETPEKLAEQIAAAPLPESVVLQITVTDSSARRAQLIAQTTAEVFVEYIAEIETPPGVTVAPIVVTIVDPADVPNEPISPKPVPNLAISLIIGLVLGATLALLRDVLDTRVRSLDDIERVVADVPILGSIHYDKAAIANPLIKDLPRHAPRVEGYRVLRTNLQFLDAAATSHVYVITSPVPNDGKSTTASNLLLSLAETGQRVLLIECDLRRPKATDYLGVPGRIGVTTLLIGRATFDEIVQPISETAAVIAAGTTPPNPAELIQSPGMAALIAEARTKFDIVLLDAPPIIPVADATLLASQADGAILVIKHAVTTRDQVKTARARLTATGSALRGIVVHASPQPKGGGGYGYGYGYGYAGDDPSSSSRSKDSGRKKRGLFRRKPKMPDPTPAFGEVLAVPPVTAADAAPPAATTVAPSAPNVTPMPAALPGTPQPPTSNGADPSPVPPVNPAVPGARRKLSKD